MIKESEESFPTTSQPFDTKRIANNLIQRVQTEFPHKSLTCLFDEMEPNSRRISNGSVRSRKWIWQIYSFSQKMPYCNWTFIKRKKLSIRKSCFIFSSLKQWKLFQNWIYWEKSEPWPWGNAVNAIHFSLSVHQGKIMDFDYCE